MFQSLSVFQTAQAMARHAGLQQSLIAQNMANSDTPGYAAKVLPDFAETLRPQGRSFALRATRHGHLGAEGQSLAAQIETHDVGNDPNGNSVTLETELLRSVETKRQHDRALAIYRSGLTILRATLGRT